MLFLIITKAGAWANRGASFGPEFVSPRKIKISSSAPPAGIGAADDIISLAPLLNLRKQSAAAFFQWFLLNARRWRRSGTMAQFLSDMRFPICLLSEKIAIAEYWLNQNENSHRTHAWLKALIQYTVMFVLFLFLSERWVSLDVCAFEKLAHACRSVWGLCVLGIKQMFLFASMCAEKAQFLWLLVRFFLSSAAAKFLMLFMNKKRIVP